MSYCPMADAELERIEYMCSTCPLSKKRDVCMDIRIPEGRFFPDLEPASEREQIIDKALNFAAMAHKGAKRKASGFPYIIHPVEVLHLTCRVVDEMGIEPTYANQIIAASALHDVIEDTKYTAEDISAAFGDEVARLVAGETENKRKDRPASETWQIRKAEAIEHVSHADIGTKIIALCDKTSNTLGLLDQKHKDGDRMFDKFNQKDPALHKWYLTSMAEAFKELGETSVYKTYVDAIEEVFGK